jgi:hypothetical protein
MQAGDCQHAVFPGSDFTAKRKWYGRLLWGEIVWVSDAKIQNADIFPKFKTYNNF